MNAVIRFKRSPIVLTNRTLPSTQISLVLESSVFGLPSTTWNIFQAQACFENVSNEYSRFLRKSLLDSSCDHIIAGRGVAWTKDWRGQVTLL